MNKKVIIGLLAIIVVLTGTVAGILLIKDNDESKVITTPKDEINNLQIDNNVSKDEKEITEEKTSDEQTEVSKISESTSSNTKTSEKTKIVVDWEKEYEKIEKRIQNEYSNKQIEIGKNTVDIDNDGVKELIVRAGTCSADTNIYFYSYQNGAPKEIGKINSGHTELYKMKNQNYLLAILGHMGFETQSKVYIKNGFLQVEKISERELGANEDYIKGDILIEFTK